ARGAGIVGRQLLEPAFVVLVETGLVVVDEDARRDVHGVHETESLLDPALPHRLLDFGGDVHEIHARGNVERERLAEVFHAPIMPCSTPLTTPEPNAIVPPCRTLSTHHRSKSRSRTSARESMSHSC